MMKKPKEDEKPKLREPGMKKKTLGLRIPSVQMPHLELVDKLATVPDIGDAPEHTTTSAPSDTSTPIIASEAVSSDTSSPSTPSTPSPSSASNMPSASRSPRRPSVSSETRQPSTPSTPSTSPQPVAPVRDFQKVPNSSFRNAIPEGFFASGKSKQVYDVLYGLTRGAIVPTRTVQIPRSKLMKLAGVGSRVTIDNILSKFQANGLLRIEFKYGEHAGNVIEVFTYDEIRDGLTGRSDTSLPSAPSTPSPSSGPSSTHILGNLDGAESSVPSAGPQPITAGISGPAKTLFKDFFKADDERAIADALEKLAEGARAATGKYPSSSEWAAFGELIDIFIEETEVARAKTASVSAYLKFGIENLRRRLYAKNGGTAAKQGREAKPRDIGKYEPEPMTAERAEAVAAEYLQILRSETADRPEADPATLDHWRRFIEAVGTRVHESVVASWFSHVTPIAIDGGSRKAVLSASEVTIEWLNANYTAVMAEAFEGIGLPGVEIEWLESAPVITSEAFRARYSDEDWKQIMEAVDREGN